MAPGLQLRGTQVPGVSRASCQGWRGGRADEQESAVPNRWPCRWEEMPASAGTPEAAFEAHSPLHRGQGRPPACQVWPLCFRSGQPRCPEQNPSPTVPFPMRQPPSKYSATDTVHGGSGGRSSHRLPSNSDAGTILQPQPRAHEHIWELEHGPWRSTLPMGSRGSAWLVDTCRQGSARERQHDVGAEAAGGPRTEGPRHLQVTPSVSVLW